MAAAVPQLLSLALFLLLLSLSVALSLFVNGYKKGIPLLRCNPCTDSMQCLTQERMCSVYLTWMPADHNHSGDAVQRGSLCLSVPWT